MAIDGEDTGTAGAGNEGGRSEGAGESVLNDTAATLEDGGAAATGDGDPDLTEDEEQDGEREDDTEDEHLDDEDDHEDGGEDVEELEEEIDPGTEHEEHVEPGAGEAEQ